MFDVTSIPHPSTPHDKRRLRACMRAPIHRSHPQVHDAAAALEAIHDSHLGQLLPRVRQCDEQVSDFLGRCVTAKTAMGRDVLEQLQVCGVLGCRG